MGTIISSQFDAKVNEIKEIGKVKGSQDPEVGDIVMKRGRTTRKTRGRVIAVDQDVFVRYQGLYDCRFINQVNIVGHPDVNKPFSAGGIQAVSLLRLIQIVLLIHIKQRLCYTREE